MSSEFIKSILKNAGVEDSDKSRDLLKKINESDENSPKDENKSKYSKGAKVKWKGKDHIIEVPDAKGDFVGIVPPGKEGDKSAVNLVKQSELTEMEEISADMPPDLGEENPEEEYMGGVECPMCGDKMSKMDFYDHCMCDHPDKMDPIDNHEGMGDENPMPGEDSVTGAKDVQLKFEAKKEIKEDNNVETNTNMYDDQPSDWQKDKIKQNIHDKDVKFDVPTKLKAMLKDKQKELLKTYEDLKHEDSKSAQFAEDVSDVITDLLMHLDKGTVEEFKKAQILATSLMSEMAHKLPNEFWDFMTTGGWVTDGSKRKDLKDYFNVIRNKDL